jgi:hypothetical protein
MAAFRKADPLALVEKEAGELGGGTGWCRIPCPQEGVPEAVDGADEAGLLGVVAQCGPDFRDKI